MVALVGSSNLDPLSLHRNFEMNALIADPETGRAMADLFAVGPREAVRVESAEWRRRPLRARAAESVATLFADLL